MRTAAIVAVIAVLVIAGVIVFVSFGVGNATRDVTLFDTGATTGDVNTSAPNSSIPPGTSPTPSPGPGANPIGTYAMGAVVNYADGSQESLISSQSLQIVFRNGKQVQSLAYVGEFRATQTVHFAQGSYAGLTGSALRVAFVDQTGAVISSVEFALTNTNVIQGGSKLTIILATVYPDQVVPTSITSGTFHFLFTMKLQPIYQNGTAGPRFYVVFPDVTITVGSAGSPPAPGGGGGTVKYLAIVDQRAFAVVKR